MSSEISLNSIELMLATTNAQSAINGLNVNLDQWENQGENSAALKALAAQFYELERAMNLYQLLLNKDIGAVRNITAEFFLSEFNLAKLWGAK